MLKIFYYGTDGKVYGPHNELTVQGWYASGFFSSDVRFQISSSDRFDPSGNLFTLGELIEKNGRILPFYFSAEKESKEKEQEEILQKLKQDVESILTNKDNYVEKNCIENLQNQVASILESNADLHKKLQELSSRKESSPVIPDLEKKFTELKKDVEKQEKNSGSMKKIISDNTSKCDRNDTKMEQALKKQKEIEEQMTAHSNQIADLQANRKNIEANLTACRQNMRGTADQCQQDRSSLNRLHELCAILTKKNSACSSELQKIQTQIADVIAAVDEHKERFAAVEKKNEEFRADLQSLNSDTATKKSAEQPSKKADISTSQSIPPWEQETKKKKEKKDDGIEPWNQVKDRKSGTEESKVNVKGEKAATASDDKKEGRIEPLQKGGGQGSEQQPSKSTKPVAKDWAAICRELSDDDEPEEVKASSYVVVPDSDLFVREFMKLLRAYCAFLEMPREATLKAATDLFKRESIRAFLTACPVDSVFSRYIREALKNELTRLFTAPIACIACKFLMLSPGQMIVHFARTSHGSRRDYWPLFGAEYDHMSETISQVFIHFITPIKQLDLLQEEEHQLLLRGATRAIDLTDADVLLPNNDFTTVILERAAKLMPKHFDEGNTTRTDQEVNALIKEACITMRTWLEDPENRRTLEADLKCHFAGGIAACGTCGTAYDELAEYYKHVTSHGHAEKDRSLFTVLISLWKGGEYWNGILGL